ncbi:SacI homology domain-containing protein / WW domain-containing protein [Heracleum sosnowskyi]|uniref:SacI homology domain-containing protein / WW domain-containing protein n=1 Tax=Heracleum sosnowskyi TaxID=360622 RepID=A0AAD8I5E6_9APIA|nr:SacI homology domain-containing protein / WW domain-containing protein [Heracleum sosnowskyi]
MAVEGGYLFRIINGYIEQPDISKSTALITRDLLGGAAGACNSSTTFDSKQLELDLQVPPGFEKRLDLKSGKVHLQRCNSPNTSSDHMHQTNQTVSKLQDLNYPPATKPLNLFDDTNLDLKLVQSSDSKSTSNYQSACTLDKVKSALERAEKETNRKRSVSMSPSKLSSSDTGADSMDSEEKSSASFAAGCPSCLLYVLLSKSNPRCPRCNMVVPLPMPLKKPRIDLNL